MASNLWSWQRAQAIVIPRNALPKTSIGLSMRLGVAGQVAPVAGAGLAVLRRGEPTIGDGREGFGGLVLAEGIDLFRARGQTRQIKGHAAQQGPLIGGGGWGQLLLLKLAQDK